MAKMASTVSLPSHSQPAFHNNLPNPHFMKWTTTQKPISSQEEDNQSTVALSHDYQVPVESSEKKESTAPDHRKPRIVIKFRIKNNNKTEDHDHKEVQNQTLVASGGGGLSNEDIKPWKLRSSSSTTSRQDQDQDHASASASVQDQAQVSHELGLGLGIAKKEKLETRKRSISIALSKEEIEADILAITRSKPTRRPKKRPKNVQRQLDNLFPGLCLKSITPNSYKV